jgi:hypothetical protein
MAEQGPTVPPRSPGRFGTLLTALIAGIAGGLMAPLIRPQLARGMRPAAKGVFKAGIALYERGREKTAELAETASDVLAEARTEYDAEQALTESDSGRSAGANEVVRLRDSARTEARSTNG